MPSSHHTGLLPVLLAALMAALPVAAGKEDDDPFRQLEELLPTPGATRTASGAPGPGYWQQFVRYRITARLDDAERRLEGRVDIEYENRSPDTLNYLWLQMDQNRFRAHSTSQDSLSDPASGRLSFARLDEVIRTRDGGFGYDIRSVTDGQGTALAHIVNDTMMRVDLPRPLMPGGKTSLSIDYGFNIVSSKTVSNRSAYEILEDGSPNYFIAMWYPRLAAYTDYGGWITKAFLYGEPALEFADFDVQIEAPDTFVLAATGTLANAPDVLSRKERQRLERAASAKKPVFIITREEADANRARKATGTKIWHFRAEQVRDFAFAASPAFLWDAQGFRTTGGRTVLAQSLYPREGDPLWSRYSTEAVLQTLETYGRLAMDYPWPHATSINAPIRSGMEYPMLAANAPRPEKDGTYSRRTKYGLIGVVIHEVGHNWFPMIVNSDERHWLWMDEGLNSFLDEIALSEFDGDAPLRSRPQDLGAAMTRAAQRPIMTQSDAYKNRGLTGYAKVTAALTVLRETVLGRELFDFAFREYVRRWAFRRPQPADFFRTMEDASGVDLDWFWRGWFYGTNHVDVAIANVTHATIDTKDPDIEAEWKRAKKAREPRSITEIRNDGTISRADRDEGLRDFYNAHDEFTVAPSDRTAYQKMIEGLAPWERDLLALGDHLTFIEFENEGGLVTPLPLEIVYEDGTREEMRLPAEIWRHDPTRATKLLVTGKTIREIRFDPYRETADADERDNNWPRLMDEMRIELTRPTDEKNLMQKLRPADEATKDETEESGKPDGS